MTAFVSVVMTTFNSIETIDAALKSIEYQDLSNIELIVIDNESKDGTVEKITRSTIKNRVISEPDGGIYEAMNKGLEFASGEWIMFLGSDDHFIKPDSLSKLLYHGGDLDLVYGTGTSGGRILKNSFNWRMLKGNSLNHQCAAYNRRIFENLKYDTAYKIAADYKLNLQLYLSRCRAEFVDIPVANFGSDGLSKKHRSLGAKEEAKIRLELLGAICGGITNLALRGKSFLSPR